jgi:hypothetical protein
MHINPGGGHWSPPGFLSLVAKCADAENRPHPPDLDARRVPIHGQSLDVHAVQGLDLSGIAVGWERMDVTGTVFLGCTFLGLEAELSLMRRGAFVYSWVGERPYYSYRGLLYTPAELLTGYRELGTKASTDSRIYDYCVEIGRQDRAPWSPWCFGCITWQSTTR